MRHSSSPPYMYLTLQKTDGSKLMLDFSKAYDNVPHNFLAVKLHHYGIRDKTYPESKVSLQIGMSKLSLMRRLLLLQLSHLEFHRVQYSDLFCCWYTSVTCLLDYPLQYDFLQMIVYCAKLFKTRRIQSHNKQISVTYRYGKEIGRWYLTQTSANISGSPISENVIQTSYNIHRQTLKEPSKAKYLGVTIDSKLPWNSQIDTVTKRANHTVTVFLGRNLSSCPKDVKAKCYKSIVRPQLEYALMV